MDDRVERRVAEVIDHAETHGWVTHREDLDAEGVLDAVGVGGILQATDGREFMFTMGLGVNADTNRVVTLRHEQGPWAALVIECGARWWWSPKTSAWTEALEDPFAWCGVDPDEDPAG